MGGLGLTSGNLYVIYVRYVSNDMSGDIRCATGDGDAATWHQYK